MLYLSLNKSLHILLHIRGRGGDYMLYLSLNKSLHILLHIRGRGGDYFFFKQSFMHI